MCTSIASVTSDNKHFLSRTMDFTFVLDGAITVIPRAFRWESVLNGPENIGKHCFIGAAKEEKGKFLFADGVNEKGLSGCALYFPGEAVYHEEKIEGKINIAAHEFLLWALGEFESIKSLESRIGDIAIVNYEMPFIKTIMPFHWILTDLTERCIVIEPVEEGLVIKENPVGVMANSPTFEWHVTNLRNYLGLRKEPLDDRAFGTFNATGFGQGTGSMGVPGGYTPPERFIRAVFLKEYVDIGGSEIEALGNIWHILESVAVPKGVVQSTNGDSFDYTQYISAMCLESKSYYYTNDTNHRIRCARLTQDMCNTLKSPKIIAYEIDQDIRFL